MAEQIYCPNCQKPSQKEGNKVTCVHCDAIYTVTKTGSATVKQLGPIDEIKGRLDKIEQSIFPEPDDPPEDDPIEEPEESIL